MSALTKAARDAYLIELAGASPERPVERWHLIGFLSGVQYALEKMTNRRERREKRRTSRKGKA